MAGSGYLEPPFLYLFGFDLIPTEAEQNIGVYEEELGGEYFYENDGSVADW